MGLKSIFPFLRKRKLAATSEADFQYFITQKLKINPHNWLLYEQAFTHRTMSKTPGESNERLEFVGDAILDAVVAIWLFQKFKDKDEGFLSKMKSRIVSRATLNNLALRMGLNEHIKSTLKSNVAVLAMGGNALEALIGALYNDQGYTITAAWVQNNVIAAIDLSMNVNDLNDSKSELYERAHKQRADLSVNTTEIESLPKPQFETVILWNDKEAGRASGTSKKLAEQNAANKALEFINGT